MAYKISGSLSRPLKAKRSTPAAAGKTSKSGSAQKTAAVKLAPLGASACHHRLDVPKATQQDIEHTLGTRRWSLFGLRFGPKNKITDVQLLTDASGLAFGAFARINGHRVEIDGALYARAAQRQIDLLAPAVKRGSASLKAPATAGAVGVPLVQAVSTSTVQSSRSLQSTASPRPSTPATSVYSEATIPLSQADTARARWSLYCDLAAEKTFFATDTEGSALALALGRDIRVIAKWPGAQGTSFTVSDFAGSLQGLTEHEPLTVLLENLHYDPLVGALADMPLLQKEHLHSDLSPEAIEAVESQLQALTKPVPGDGACFFHSIAALTQGEPGDLRAQAVAFMRAHGETLKIASVSVEGFEQTLSENYMPHPTSKAYQTLMERFPDQEG